MTHIIAQYAIKSYSMLYNGKAPAITVVQEASEFYKSVIEKKKMY